MAQYNGVGTVYKDGVQVAIVEYNLTHVTDDLNEAADKRVGLTGSLILIEGTLPSSVPLLLKTEEGKEVRLRTWRLPREGEHPTHYLVMSGEAEEGAGGVSLNEEYQ